MTARPARPTRRRAFTLVEILIVVTIMGVAGALIVPSMLSAGTLGLQGAARLVVADIQYAQQEALAAGRERGIEFDPVTDRYRMFDENGRTIDLNWMRTGGRVDTLDGSGNVVERGWTVDFRTDNRFSSIDLVGARFEGRLDGSDVNPGNASATPATLRFDASGTPTGGTRDGTVQLRHAENAITIVVDGFTGRVTLR